MAISAAIALLIAGLASAGAALGGSAFNAKAVKEANETNLELNRQNNQTNIALAQDEMVFNSAEAQKQRDWEQMMSDTAVQRRMTDLQAAGVNPMLALGSPAQMASGASASASTVRTQAGSVDPVFGVGDGLKSIASIAQSAAMMMALSKIKGDNAKVNADARNRGYQDYSYKLSDGSWLRERRYI